MKIFARGEKTRIAAIQQLLTSQNAEWVTIDELEQIPAHLDVFDLIFDLAFDEQDQLTLIHYAPLKGKLVLVSAVKKSLAQAVSEYAKPVDCVLVGINALPTFIERNLLEISLYKTNDQPQIEKLLSSMEVAFAVVKDRVGMATPRVVCMIINEACYTLQEGTATIHDIDVSMKLGTNYPMGPFEWANLIGISNVYEVLESVYTDTHDERYKICPLLKRQYLLNEPFNL
ncbi:MAG: 3-hydroxyacyl-CoA dehydrogenase family protein [Bacteroidia bacterium]|jgi:3-hydroxybutyryl-CoA dehydrogenase|nr:3-hydroxyacyl-CoA dehydrogenase family protein [Bacteroidia bacterium]